MSAPKRFAYSVSEGSGTPTHAEPDWTAAAEHARALGAQQVARRFEEALTWT